MMKTSFFTRRRFNTNTAALFAAVALAFMPVLAQAQVSLEEARNQELVGENRQGLLSALVNRPDVIQLVEGINRERLEAYQSIARDGGIPLNQVQAIAAEKLYSRLPAGSILQGENGQWVRK